MNPILIIVNGEKRETTASSLNVLLEELSLPLSTVLVEQNGVALHHHEIKAACLSAGDRIEILKIVAGG